MFLVHIPHRQPDDDHIRGVHVDLVRVFHRVLATKTVRASVRMGHGGFREEHRDRSAPV